MKTGAYIILILMVSIILELCIKQSVILGSPNQCLDDVNTPIFGQIICTDAQTEKPPILKGGVSDEL